MVFQLFSNHSEDYRVGFIVESETRQTPRYGNVAAGEVPYLGCSVTINKAKDRLVIIGINRHHAHDLPTSISIEDFAPAATARVFELNGSSHSAHNDFNTKDNVKIQEKEFTSVSSDFIYNFPAHSVTVLILTRKK